VSFNARTKAERGGQNPTPHSVLRQLQKDLPPRRLLCSSTRGSDPNYEQRAAIQLDIFLLLIMSRDLLKTRDAEASITEVSLL
jgi:hypothetical protein